MLVGFSGRSPPGRGADQEARLQKVRLDDVGEGVDLLLNRRCQGLDADWPALVTRDHGLEDLAIKVIQAQAVDPLELQRLARTVQVDLWIAPHLSEIAHPPQEAIRDPRRAA